MNQEMITKATEKSLERLQRDTQLATWRMLTAGKLYSRGWRLAVRVVRNGGRTYEVAPGEPVPEGSDRVIGL